MKLKINDELMFGDYTEEQTDKIFEEMQKLKEKRKYLFGIEFSAVDEVEIIK